MTKLSLIVKGNKYAAARAAAHAGVPFVFIREVRGIETVGLTNIEMWDKVAAWFAEGSKQAPFPTGTLLLYTEID